MIEISKPVCQAGRFGSQRIDGVHGRHLVWSGGSEAFQCEGLTQEQADVTAMLNELRVAASDMDLDWRRDNMVFECHPAVPNLIAKYIAPSFAEFTSGPSGGLIHRGTRPVDDLGLPVRAVDGMPWGGWRIVLAEGKITDDRI
jgi:hypothetical protein